MRPLGGEVMRVYRARWRQLLVVSLAIFVPLGLIEAANLGEVEIDDIGAAEAGALIAGGLAAAASALLGEVLVAGVVAALFVEWRTGEPHPLRQIARTLPYGRLVGADLLYGAAVALGMLLLVVPGIVFLCWFALAAPAIKIERRGVRDGFRRSRALVRGNFWRVLGIVAPLLLASDLLTAGAGQLSDSLLGSSFAAEWARATLAELLTVPFWALAVVVIFCELSGRGSPAGGRPVPNP